MRESFCFLYISIRSSNYIYKTKAIYIGKQPRGVYCNFLPNLLWYEVSESQASTWMVDNQEIQLVENGGKPLFITLLGFPPIVF